MIQISKWRMYVQLWMTARELSAKSRSNILRYYTQDWEVTLHEGDHAILGVLL